MTENVIDNTLLKSFNFKTIDEVYKYKNLTVTQQSDYFIKFISFFQYIEYFHLFMIKFMKLFSNYAFLY